MPLFYRVRADLAFLSQDEGNDFYHDCELAILKANTINPGTPDEEKGHILLEDCHHADPPGYSCDKVKEQFTP